VRRREGRAGAAARRLALAAALLVLGITLTARAAGGEILKARLDAGGAQVVLTRYSAPASGSGPPIVIFPELGFSHVPYEPLALALQKRGRDVFVLDWRGCGRSSNPVRGAGGLEALLLGDAPAALDAALAATKAPRAQLIGHGLGGTAAVLLAASERGARVSALALLSVPVRWEVPNEAVRKLLAAIDGRPAPRAALVDLERWSSTPSPVAPLLPGASAPDLFELLLAHGTALSPARTKELRAGLGKVSPELLRDLRRWMEKGDLVLPEGPLAHGGSLLAAYARLGQPVLAAAALRDDLVHPEHALAFHRAAPQVPLETLVLQRLEGFSEDAGHLAPLAAWAPSELGPRLHAFFEAHQ
jgi:pimeloyl-ACP methyl ester carboxylesterase